MNFGDEETVAVDTLLTCSDWKENHERYINTCSCDEICSWKSVAPMCMYVKPKRKKELKNKRKMHYFKQHFFESLPNDCENSFPYRHHLRNLAYCSTNVLSYDSPSSRDIVDMRTFHYLEREQFKNWSSYFIRENAHATLLYGQDYKIQIKGQNEDIDEQLLSNVQTYLDNTSENCENLHRLHSFHNRNEQLKRAKPRPLFQVQLTTAKPISLEDQLHLTTMRLPTDVHYESTSNGMFVSTTKLKSESNHKNNKKKYVMVSSKCKKKRKYDNELIKIRTCLPPVKVRQKETSKSPLFDESEEETDFPFRVSCVRDGRNVSQNINIDNLTTYVIDERNISYYSKGKGGKMKENIELPPIAGLHLS